MSRFGFAKDSEEFSTLLDISISKRQSYEIENTGRTFNSLLLSCCALEIDSSLENLFQDILISAPPLICWLLSILSLPWWSLQKDHF